MKKTRAPKTVRWQACNVLWQTEDRRQLWQFSRAGQGVKLQAERSFTTAEHVPASIVAHSVVQQRWNVAWLPANQVFLRVLELPLCPPEELPGMVEFKLEEFSPVPLAQAVWTVESIPTPDGQAQSAIVVIVPREAVERFLGEVEQAGFTPDRLELPLLRELLATEAGRDGAWISTRLEGDRLVSLVAWWQKGRLRNVNLFDLAEDGRTGARFAERLGQLAWAGEIEGWHESEAGWHLFAQPAVAERLLPAVQETVTGNIEVRTPLAPVQLAALSAQGGVFGNLLPADVATRYRRDFNGRLWVNGLLIAAALYCAGVAIYLGALQFLQYQKRGVDRQIGLLQSSYTNSLQLKAQVRVLEDQVALKFAALDCWRAATEALPEELTLTQLSFQGRARKLQLFGIVPADQQARVTTFNEALGKATLNGQAMFSKVNTKSIQALPQGGRPATWTIECELFRSDL
ncbi:MAG: hypothetical protein ACYC23_21585 [Limisphaerales bacterium]